MKIQLVTVLVVLYPTIEELDEFDKSLSKCGTPAILSIIPGYCEAYIPVQENDLPPPLSDLFKEEYLGTPYTDLL